MNGLAPTTSCLIAEALKYDLRHQFGDMQRGNLVSFLDLVLWNNAENIEYARHLKKIHSFNYIHQASWHPWATKKGVIHSQFIRIIITNSEPCIRNIFVELLMRKLFACGYSPRLLKSILNRTTSILNTPGYIDAKKLANIHKRCRHILSHFSYNSINSKLQKLYSHEGITSKYNFSQYNPKCMRQHLKDLYTAIRERIMNIQSREKCQKLDDPLVMKSEIGTLEILRPKTYSQH
ncbi:hypothetical protein RF11_12566 [Thelohanellus kitauei]|uniref:Helix-turn-helix domain-containing protein n=1 Tax=Thelohanellus kitauei TaxID=669202 RepID=A0A0C2J0S5_THEKT|nr:hypothetical protein RF11_12566 [Thelohanellus kitauei]